MKTLIVEDNPGAANVLQSFLREYPGKLELVGIARSVDEARRMIREKQPDLWLLDIRLQDQLIFQLLQELDPATVANASILFLTAYYEPEYIHDALRHAALDYIVKPVDRDQLYAALDKARERARKSDLVNRIVKLEAAIQDLITRPNHTRMPIYRVNGEIDYVDKQEVMMISTADDVSRISLADGTLVATTRPLKYYDEWLRDDPAFFRGSKQVILHLAFIKTFHPKTDVAILADGTTVQLSRRRGVELAQIISGKK